VLSRRCWGICSRGSASWSVDLITPSGNSRYLTPRVPDTLGFVRQVTEDGRSTRWADHRAQRRTELAQVARRGVHRGGPDVSMDELAAAAGTSESIVYRYFEDKTGLQIAVAELVISDISAALDAAASAASNPREGLRSMIDVYLAMVEHSPNVYFFVTRPVGEDASG